MSPNKCTPFGGAEFQFHDIDLAGIVVLPLCYENAPSYGTGSAEAPYHILDASSQLEGIDEETLIDWTSFRIHTTDPLIPSNDPEQAVLEMGKAAEKILKQKKFLLSIGGDHAVSLGPIKAASTLYPDMSVLQIDAHLDMRDRWNGSRYNHACVMRRVVEDMRLPVVQVGIRSFSKEEADYIKSRNLTPVYAHEIDPWDSAWLTRTVNRLSETVYVTLDLDGLDPSVIPGTGTPEPGGLSYRQLVKLIERVGKERKVVAADITELSKIEGSHVSEFTAAKIATKFFVYCL
ncbi:MAG: agmatinase [Pseudomonadota bacterium]